MGRRRAISNEEVLAAARAVFLQKGVGATTAEVAARCGVGEATIYRRFPSKQALLRAALDFEGQPAWAQMAVDRIGEPDLRRLLVDLGASLIAWARTVMPARLLRMLNAMAEAAQRRPLLLLTDKVLLELFEAARRKGQLRIGDPRVAARVYLGTLRDHVLREVMQVGSDLSEEELLGGLADLLCEEQP